MMILTSKMQGLIQYSTEPYIRICGHVKEAKIAAEKLHINERWIKPRWLHTTSQGIISFVFTRRASGVHQSCTSHVGFGVVLLSDDGAVEVHNSFPGRTTKARFFREVFLPEVPNEYLEPCLRHLKQDYGTYEALARDLLKDKS